MSEPSKDSDMPELRRLIAAAPSRQVEGVDGIWSTYISQDFVLGIMDEYASKAIAAQTLQAVPVEPTEVMIEAGKSARMQLPEGTIPGVVLAAIWRAMASAAPPTQATAVEAVQMFTDEQIAKWKELASKGVQASLIIGNLPELGGYNGSILTIDDTEAERIEADIDLIVDAIRALIDTAAPSQGAKQ